MSRVSSDIIASRPLRASKLEATAPSGNTVQSRFGMAASSAASGKELSTDGTNPKIAACRGLSGRDGIVMQSPPALGHY